MRGNELDSQAETANGADFGDDQREDMGEAVKKIAVVQGMPGALVQKLFRDLARHWQASARLVGVIAEDHGLPGRACSAGYLCSLSNGERFPIFQDLGSGSKDCHLAPGGALDAAAAVRRDIAGGCDLVMLSKFGKLEAGGGGLRDAFAAAIEAGVPMLTTVSPACAAAWDAFAAPWFTVVPADAERIGTWWQGCNRQTGAKCQNESKEK